MRNRCRSNERSGATNTRNGKGAFVTHGKRTISGAPHLGTPVDCLTLWTYPHTDGGVEVRRVFHKLRSLVIENFNEHFKGIFGAHCQVPTKGLINTQRFALGAIFVYQLALLYRFEQGQPLNI